MKKNHNFQMTLATLLLAMMAINANARSWRINNDATKKPHFTSINAACSSADVQNGDTLYLDPGCLIASQTISKSITLIGTGYASTVHTTAKITGSLYIKAANAKVEGVYITGYVRFYASHVTLERCRIDSNIDSDGAAQYATIRQCMLNIIYGAGATSTNTMGWTIENCIIRVNYQYGAIGDLYNPVIRNNFIRNSGTTTSTSYKPSVLYNISGGDIQNNILTNVKNTRAQVLWSVSNSLVQNNVMTCPADKYTSSYPNNTCLDLGYEDAEKLLFTLTGEDMNVFRLADESPAKGAGTSGEDCGPFAGAYPFVVYGRPYGIPYFEESQVGVRAVDGKVSVKQKVTIQND